MISRILSEQSVRDFAGIFFVIVATLDVAAAFFKIRNATCGVFCGVCVFCLFVFLRKTTRILKIAIVQNFVLHALSQR